MCIRDRVLKPSGRFAILYMAWLPEEDPIAGASEELVLKYNPSWTGKGETRHYIAVPEALSLIHISPVWCQLRTGYNKSPENNQRKGLFLHFFLRIYCFQMCE